MKIAVFGLGYVGAVTAALLAEQGNEVIGIDLNPIKAKSIRDGESPVLEPMLGDIISSTTENGSLSAGSDPAAALDWNVAFICVGTPSAAGGQIDSSALRAVVDQIGQQIKNRSDFPVVAIRSTVAPHCLNDVVIPQMTDSAGSAPGTDYGLVAMPEFLREGSSVSDFHNPPFTLIGESDSRAGDIVEELFSFVSAPVVRLSMGEAFMVKYASNAYHALKVAFANEIGLMCAEDGLDSHKVMDAFCLDTKLNVSKRYLKPGFAFGGSCLPKDLRELNHRARQGDIETPLLGSILVSNTTYLNRCCDRVLATGKRQIGVLGFSFKSGTDDLRESPMVEMIERLLGKGKEIYIYDSTVQLDSLTGANREYIYQTIPHVASLTKPSLEDVLRHAEVIVIGNAEKEFADIESMMSGEQLLIDFSGRFAPMTGPGQPHRKREGVEQRT